MRNVLEVSISSIKMQKFHKLFPLFEALEKGTIYKELYKPFLMERGCNYE